VRTMGFCPVTFKKKKKDKSLKPTRRSVVENNHSYSLWIVENKHETDDPIALVLVEHGMAEKSAKLAWKHFLKLCGGDMDKWKKLGYRARQIEVSVRFKK
jgi:hypothetical protein